jgi:hypothetical protein
VPEQQISSLYLYGATFWQHPWSCALLAGYKTPPQHAWLFVKNRIGDCRQAFGISHPAAVLGMMTPLQQTWLSLRYEFPWQHASWCPRLWKILPLQHISLYGWYFLSPQYNMVDWTGFIALVSRNWKEKNSVLSIFWLPQVRSGLN